VTGCRIKLTFTSVQWHLFLLSTLGDLHFTNRIHGISGTVALPDSQTISITDFNYDGGGVGRILKSVYMNDDEYT